MCVLLVQLFLQDKERHVTWSFQFAQVNCHACQPAVLCCQLFANGVQLTWKLNWSIYFSPIDFSTPFQRTSLQPLYGVSVFPPFPIGKWIFYYLLMTKNECNEHICRQGIWYTDCIFSLSHTGHELGSEPAPIPIHHYPSNRGQGSECCHFAWLWKCVAINFIRMSCFYSAMSFVTCLGWCGRPTGGRAYIYYIMSSSSQPRLRTESHLSRARTRACTVHEYDKWNISITFITGTVRG